MNITVLSTFIPPDSGLIVDRQNLTYLVGESTNTFVLKDNPESLDDIHKTNPSYYNTDIQRVKWTYYQDAC